MRATGGKPIGREPMLPEPTGARLLTPRATHTLADTAAQLDAQGLTTATGTTRAVGTVGPSVQQQ